jgi:hypothetical protein
MREHNESEQLERDDWHWNRQGRTWDQYWQHGYDTPQPTAAQAYAAQSSWEDDEPGPPYPSIPGPSRQFVDNAWKNYNKRGNDDPSQEDSRAWKGSRRR